MRKSHQPDILRYIILVCLLFVILFFSSCCCCTSLTDDTPTPDITVGPKGWTVVGEKGFSSGKVSFTSLYVSGDTPYVAYKDEGNDGRITVKKFNGTSWETVGTEGFIKGDYVTLAYYGDSLYLACRDENNKATVKKFAGTSWETVGTEGFSGGETGRVAFDIYDAKLYVACSDSNKKITVKKYEKDKWETLGSEAIAVSETEEFSLTAYKGTTLIAYAGEDKKLGVIAEYGLGWDTIESENFSSPASSLSIDCDTGYVISTPYVAYRDEGNGGKASVMKCGDSWEWEPAGTNPVSSGTADFISIIYYNNMPYIAYKDTSGGGQVTVKRLNGTDWESLGQDSAGAGEWISIRGGYGEKNAVYVAYSDLSNGGKIAVMKHEVE